MTDGARWWRRSAGVSTALVLALGACGGGGDDDAIDDPTTLTIVAATGDAVAGIQNERCGVRRALGGSDERCGEALYAAQKSADRGLGDIAEAAHETEIEVYLDLEPVAEQATVDLAEPRGQLARAGAFGGGGRIDDGGVTAALYNPIVADVLEAHLRYADLVEDDDMAALAQLYARTSLQIEDVDRVAALASGDPAAWPGQIGAFYDAITAGRDRLAVLAQDTDLADATADLDDALTEAGFGGPPPPEAPGGDAPFVDSLALEAWRDYRHAVRDRLDAAG
jgi:hypothetical protein